MVHKTKKSSRKEEISCKNFGDSLLKILETEKSEKIESIINEGIQKGVLSKEIYPVAEAIRSISKPIKGIFELYSDSADAIARKYNYNCEGKESHKNIHDLKNNINGDIKPIETSFRHNKAGRGNSDYNIIHSDNGAGQTEENFTRLLGQTTTGESSKRNIDFIHGRMNRGRLLSLASSKLKLVASSSHEEPNNWTWTIIFRKDGDVYTLRDSNGELFEHQGEISPSGHDTRTHGCIIKLFDYGMDNPRDATGGKFERVLSKNLPFPPFDLKIIDRRYESEKTYCGVEDLIEKKDFLRDKFTTTVENPMIGEIQIKCYIRNSDCTDSEQRTLFYSNNDSRLIIPMCGQSHFKDSVSLVSSRIDHKNISEDIVIFARMKNVRKINNRDKAVFGQDRDSFVEDRIRESVLDTIYSTLNDSNRIKNINNDDCYKTTDPEKLNPDIPDTIVEDEKFKIEIERDIPENCDVDITVLDDNCDIKVVETSNSYFVICPKYEGSHKSSIDFYYSVDDNRCNIIKTVEIEPNEDSGGQNSKSSKYTSEREFDIPSKPTKNRQNGQYITTEDLREHIKSDLVGKKGNLLINIGDIEKTIENNDSMGSVVEALVGEILERENIAYAERQNSQLPPDYVIYDHNGNVQPLEVKAFSSETGPCFDIGDLAAYIDLISAETNLLDSKYLIFEYSMDCKDIVIERYWMKNVWEIAGESGKNPMKLQVKRNKPYNIRPVLWYSDNSSYEPFNSKECFVEKLYRTMIEFPQFGQVQAKKWLEHISNKDSELSKNDFEDIK